MAQAIRIVAREARKGDLVLYAGDCSQQIATVKSIGATYWTVVSQDGRTRRINPSWAKPQVVEVQG